MIGAMPAVAVRHERLKQNRQQVGAFGGTSRDSLLSNGVSTQHIRRSSRPVRPNHLPIRARTFGSSYTVSSIATPSCLSPVQLSSAGTTPLSITPMITPRQAIEPLTAEQKVTDYCCYGKFPLLHVTVISLILGITLLIVGLVQLKPNADSEAKKYLFLGSAATCFSVGFLGLSLRSWRRYCFRRRINAPRRMVSNSKNNESCYSFVEIDETDRSSSVDSMALLQQRF